MRSLVAGAAALLLLALATPVLAQEEGGGSLGKVTPDASLETGSVAVRVVLGSMSRPAASVAVSLVDEDNGKERVVRADPNGRALFKDLDAGGHYSAYTEIGDKQIASEPMTIPEKGGLQVVLSPTPVRDALGEAGEMPAGHGGAGGGASGMPDPRQMSGMARPQPGDPAGTLTVRTIQGRFRMDPIKGRVADFPKDAVVYLVGYGRGGEVTVQSKHVDGEGRVKFEKLATDNSVSYYVLATFDRDGIVDRLQSSSVELPPRVGLRLMLAGEAPDSGKPGADDLPIFRQRPDTKLPGAGEVSVELAGQAQLAKTVELVGAGGEVVATAPVTSTAARREVSGSTSAPAADAALRDHLVQIVARGPKGEALPGVAVRLVAGSEVAAEATTGAEGRANLQGVAAGTEVVVVASVDGQEIRSKPFAVPASGGSRVELSVSWKQAQAVPTAHFSGVAPGKIYYVRTRAGKRSYLSPPFQMVPDRGAVVGILIYPDLLFGFQGGAELDDELMWFQMRVAIANPSLAPLDTGADGLLIPLPPGFKGASVADEMAARIKVDPDHGFIWHGPFPPGQREFNCSFALPVEDGSVHFAMPLPFGLWNSHIVFEDFPGMQLDVPTSAKRQPRETDDGRRFILLSDINIRAGQTLEFSVRGLPQAPGWKRAIRIVAGIGVLLLLVWGFGSALKGKLEAGRGGGNSLEDQRERLLAKVVALDQKWEKSRISAAEHSRRRAALVQQLEEIYRELEAR